MKPPLRPGEPLPTLTLGAVIEGTAYRAVHKLGEGGMGAVYEVVHLPTGERRALKIVRRPFVGGSEREERFLLEVLALERLTDARHVVRIFEQGRTPGCPYYVMEYIEPPAPPAPRVSEAAGVIRGALRARPAPGPALRVPKTSAVSLGDAGPHR
jgi:protein kinase-like protein